MTGVCDSVKMYENMNSSLLSSVVAPEGKTQLSKLGCQDAWVSCRGWDWGDRLPAHRWWALVRVCVASEMGKEVSWILSESPWRQIPNATSIVWPELVGHSTTWQNRGKCQEEQWGTESPLLAWSAAQGVSPLTGRLVLGHCGGTTEAHLSFLLEAPVLFYMGTYVTAKEGLDHVKSDCHWGEGQVCAGPLLSPWSRWWSAQGRVNIFINFAYQQMFPQLMLKTSIWLLGPWDLLRRLRTARKR